MYTNGGGVRLAKVDQANGYHIKALWNAANGMTTEEAVRYLEHGREMVLRLNHHCAMCQLELDDSLKDDQCKTCYTTTLLAKLESKKMLDINEIEDHTLDHD